MEGPSDDPPTGDPDRRRPVRSRVRRAVSPDRARDRRLGLPQHREHERLPHHGEIRRNVGARAHRLLRDPVGFRLRRGPRTRLFVRDDGDVDLLHRTARLPDRVGPPRAPDADPRGHQERPHPRRRDVRPLRERVGARTHRARGGGRRDRLPRDEPRRASVRDACDIRDPRRLGAVRRGGDPARLQRARGHDRRRLDRLRPVDHDDHRGRLRVLLRTGVRRRHGNHHAEPRERRSRTRVTVRRDRRARRECVHRAGVVDPVFGRVGGPTPLDHEVLHEPRSHDPPMGGADRGHLVRDLEHDRLLGGTFDACGGRRRNDPGAPECLDRRPGVRVESDTGRDRRIGACGAACGDHVDKRFVPQHRCRSDLA